MRRTGAAAAVATAVAVTALAWSAASAQEWRTMTSSRQVWETEAHEVEISYGAGELTITPAEPRVLYRMEIRYDANVFEPLVEYDQDDRQIALGVRSLRAERRGRGRGQNSARANIALARDIPLDLDLEFGAGEADIELGGMSLRSLSIATGASDTDISFSEPNRIAASDVKIQAGAADLEVIGLGNLRASRVEFEGGVGATVLDFSGAAGDMTASVEIGVGSVTLRLPRSHGIQVNRSSFLTSFDAAGLAQQGNSYFSSNWSSAANKMVLDVSAALGSIEIEWVE